MIHTLTLNTAIDMNIFCDPLQPAAVNRTRQTEYCPNGKGVNVSLVLHHYQQPTHVMGIFGGFTGRYIVEELRKQHINVTPAWVAEPTRINIFINDGRDEYKLVNPGARINDEGKEQILHHLQCVTPGDYLVISGSLPPGIESRFYSEILVLCQQKGCEVILDISHPVLRQLLEWRPLLIKPNDDLHSFEVMDIESRHGITLSLSFQQHVFTGNDVHFSPLFSSCKLFVSNNLQFESNVPIVSAFRCDQPHTMMN